MAPDKPIRGSVLTLLCLMAKLKEEALEFVESYKGNCSFPLGSICVSNVQHSTAIRKFSETTTAFQHGS